MKNLIALSSGIAVLVAAGVLLAQTAVTPQPTRGKVLVLENEQTLEGDIERLGAQYRIRRASGETWVPAERVLRLCATGEEALRCLQTRTNLNDGDERLRLAHWCRQHGLLEQAVAEARAAVQLRPSHAESRRLLTLLEEAAAAQAAQPAQAARRDPEPAPALHLDLTAESLGMFATKVQPVLMNTCVSCHGNGRGGSFRLARCYGAGLLHRKTTQQNLAAVLAQINVQQPLASPLLTRAVSVHGDAGTAPLQGRNAPPYRLLEEWVRLTVAGNPQLRDPAAPASALPPSSGLFGEMREPANLPAAPVSPPAAAATVLPPAPAPVAAPAPAAPAQPAAPPPPAPAAVEPEDPFDPAAFNRQVHPDRVRPAPPAPRTPEPGPRP